MSIKNQKGQFLLEVLLSLGVFLVFITGSVILVARYSNSTIKSNDLHEADLILSESVGAIESVADDDFTNLADGTYGLVKTSGVWVLQGSPDTVKGRYTRTITIEPIMRDDNCAIVSSGGTDDPDSKNIVIDVSWLESGANRSQYLEKLITNWENPSVGCGQTEAGNTEIDVSGATIDATKKQIVGVVLKNTGLIAVTIDKMLLTWTEPGEIIEIKIENVNHWKSTGPGTPSGSQPSGTLLDMEDLVMDPGGEYDIDRFRFDDKIDGSTVTITIVMSDGSSTTEITTPPFVP